MRRAALGLALGLVLFARPCFSAASPSELSQKIDAILAAPGLKNVLFSACVIRCDSGEVVYEKDPHLTLLPASNMKIMTSAVALERLGRDFEFVTRVGLCGTALVVIGSGDPLLGDKETDAKNGRRLHPLLQDIAGRLKAAGVASVSDIILDTTIFDSQRVHPSWPANQLHQKYACEVSGINYNGNCVDLAVFNRDGTIVLSLDPPTDFLRLVNRVTPRLFGPSQFSVERTSVPNQLIVSGTCRTQAGPYSVAVENPALLFGRLLRDALNRAGVKVQGQVQEAPLPAGCDFSPLAEFRTSLSDCLLRADRDSLGLAAEALFKRVAAQSQPEGKGGSWSGGREVIYDYLRSLGLSDSDFAVADGSGLSRDNRLSAHALTQVLCHLAAGPDWEFFKGTLAVGGLDGTLGHHFWEKKYRGRVLAKSGFITAVRALSGVVHTDSGDFIFSFVANKAGNGARLAIDAAVKAIMDWGAAPVLPGRKPISPRRT